MPTGLGLKAAKSPAATSAKRAAASRTFQALTAPVKSLMARLGLGQLVEREVSDGEALHRKLYDGLVV